MPPTTCPAIIPFDLSKDNGLCRFIVEVTWDGTSGPPPACNGTVTRVTFNNTGQKTWYLHLPTTRLGPAVYQIIPGDSRNVTNRTILHAAGLDDKTDVQTALDLNEVPPSVDERLLNP